MNVEEIPDTSKIANLSNKIDNVCEGYMQSEVLSALLTVVTWAIVDISKNNNISLEIMLENIKQGLKDSVWKTIEIHKREMN